MRIFNSFVIRQFGFIVLNFILCIDYASPSSILDLKISSLSVKETTIVDILIKLAEYGVLIGFEKGCFKEKDHLISVDLKDSVIREALDTITDLDNRYTWRAYAIGGGQLDKARSLIVNVFPRNKSRDPDWLMNIRVKKGAIKETSPSEAISQVALHIPELYEILYSNSGGITGSSLSGIGAKVQKFNINIEFEDLSVREILNEISLRSGGNGWIFECHDGEETSTFNIFP